MRKRYTICSKARRHVLQEFCLQTNGGGGVGCEEREANERRRKKSCFVYPSTPFVDDDDDRKKAKRIRFHSPTETCIIFLSSFFPFSSRLSHPPSSPFFSDVWPGKKFDFGVFGCGPTPTAHKKCPRKKGKKGSLHFFVLHPSPPLLLPRDASQSLDRSAVAVSRMSAAAACCQQESLSRLWPLWPVTSFFSRLGSTDVNGDILPVRSGEGRRPEVSDEGTRN